MSITFFYSHEALTIYKRAWYIDVQQLLTYIQKKALKFDASWEHDPQHWPFMLECRSGTGIWNIKLTIHQKKMHVILDYPDHYSYIDALDIEVTDTESIIAAIEKQLVFISRFQHPPTKIEFFRELPAIMQANA